MPKARLAGGLLDLIARPNPVCSAPDLLESWYGFLLVSGNAYLEAVAIGGTPRELHTLRPDRMKVIPGPEGWPEAFEYTADGRTVRFAGEVDILDGASVKRTLATTTPSATYTAAQQTADFGAPQPSIDVRAYQLSTVFGRGTPTAATL